MDLSSGSLFKLQSACFESSSNLDLVLFIFVLLQKILEGKRLVFIANFKTSMIKSLC